MDLPYGMRDYSDENADRLLEELNKRQISVLDLRQNLDVEKIDKSDLFYKTDHHWSMKTCFTTFGVIAEAIYGWTDLDLSRYTDIDEYTVYTQENSFLGSYGIKVGEYYAGKADFTVYAPSFDTDFTFRSYDHDGNVLIEKTAIGLRH